MFVSVFNFELVRSSHTSQHLRDKTENHYRNEASRSIMFRLLQQPRPCSQTYHFMSPLRDSSVLCGDEGPRTMLHPRRRMDPCRGSDPYWIGACFAREESRNLKSESRKNLPWHRLPNHSELTLCRSTRVLLGSELSRSRVHSARSCQYQYLEQLGLCATLL